MKKIFLILILLSNFLFAQIIKSWHNYSNLRSVAQSCLVDGAVWAATDGGAFSFYPNDSTYQILTKSEGLLSQNITAISSDDENKIWLGTNEQVQNKEHVDNNDYSYIASGFCFSHHKYLQSHLI